MNLIVNEHKTLNSVLDQFLRHTSTIYRNRLDFIADLKQSLRILQGKQNMSLFAQKNNATDSAGRATMLRQLMNPRDGTMGDIAVGEWLIVANDKPTTELKDNTKEYFVRYHPFKPKTFDAQVAYMQKIFAAAKKTRL